MRLYFASAMSTSPSASPLFTTTNYLESYLRPSPRHFTPSNPLHPIVIVWNVSTVIAACCCFFFCFFSLHLRLPPSR